MSTVAIPNEIRAGQPLDPRPVMANFDALALFINDDVLTLDGSKAMTGHLTLSGPGVAGGHAVTKAQLDDALGGDVAGGGYLPLAGGTLTGDLSVNGQIRVNQGSTAAPGYSFTNGTNSGMYNNGKDVYFAADGTEILRLGKAFGLRMNGKQVYNASFVAAAIGSQEAPAFRFDGASQNGMYGNPSYVAFTVKGSNRLVIYEDRTLVQANLEVKGLIDGQLGPVPADFWAPADGTVFAPQGMTSGTQGSYATSMTANGYRNSGGKWTSLENGGDVGATEINLKPNGSFEVRAKSDHPTGSSSNPHLQFLVTDTETKAYGDLAVNGQVLGKQGTIETPAYSFGSDKTTGFYRQGNGSIGIASSGKYVGRFNVNGLIGVINSALVVTAKAGSVTAPTYSFADDTRTGIWRQSAGSVGVTCDGTEVLRIGKSFGLRMNGKPIYNASYVRTANGTKAAPAYSFDSDSKSGMYSVPAGNFDSTKIVGIAANGKEVANFGDKGVSFPTVLASDRTDQRPNIHMSADGQLQISNNWQCECTKSLTVVEKLSATVDELTAKIAALAARVDASESIK